MRTSETVIDTDYLVIGAGASGMALVDALVTEKDVSVVMIDRRHAPGGHWVDAYPFVRLHQPSAYYGINSLPLGQDRIDTEGINAGFYERASAADLCHYYERALRVLEQTGRVRFLANREYRAGTGEEHVVVSTLDGGATRIRVRRRLVNAAYVESVIPATHRPTYRVAPGVRFVTPNDLVRLAEPAALFTLLGGGKTAMDACYWLLEQGVDPERIRWIRPRDGWFVERSCTQPLDLIGAMAAYQSRTIEVCASARTGLEFALALEEHGMMCRLDRAVEAEIYRGATVARGELEALASIGNVVRGGRVRSIDRREIVLSGGTIPALPDTVYVDCTAQGLATSEARPIFAGDTLIVQFTTLGVAPWSAAIVGFVESLDIDDEEKNRLCPPVPRTGLIADQLRILARGFHAEVERRGSSEIAQWSQRARLNPTRAMALHMDDPEVHASMARAAEFMGPALMNLAGIAAQSQRTPVGASR